MKSLLNAWAVVYILYKRSEKEYTKKDVLSRENLHCQILIIRGSVTGIQLNT